MCGFNEQNIHGKEAGAKLQDFLQYKDVIVDKIQNII